MNQKLVILATMVTMALLAGCDTAKSPKGATGNQAAASTPNKEDVAKEKLKTALDAWVFGDSVEKFAKDHPEYSGPPPIHDWMSKKVLMRYEIGACRFENSCYKFVVTHVFQSEGGTEIKESVIYWVTPPEGMKDHKWAIMAVNK